ncbi:MAG: hypothetical protein HY673_25805 [Chloroflexi bacterium]|nr:hypothetical protein [Chloroflexota bacterium]
MIKERILPVTLDVDNPTGPVEITELHAPRLDSLAGKTVCEISNDKWEIERVFGRVRELLRQRYPGIKIIPYTEFPQGTHEIQTDEIARLVREKGGQAAIVGNAA